MSLYTLDGTTRKLLRLDRFGTPDFSVKSFIEQLSGGHDYVEEDQRLDPKPYIRTFESASVELERLLGIAKSQEDAAEEEARDLNAARGAEAQDIAAHVESCMDEVKLLDEIAAEIQQTNGPAGQRLRRVSKQHAATSNYRALISAYLAFYNDKPSPELARLWAVDRRRCAHFVGELQKLATAIGSAADHEVQKRIDKYAEDMENRLVATFQEKYQHFDLPGMRESAEISTEFNGGGAIVRAYINQHPFFMNLTQLQQDELEEEGLDSMYAQLNHTEARYSELQQVVDKLFTEITDEITKETEIITKVFPHPEKVLLMFIQRTFAQRVQSIVSKYMDAAVVQPTKLAQVRVLSVCYTRINEMVNALQSTWSKSTSGLSAVAQSELGKALEQNYSDAVLPYIDDYFDLEKESLRELIQEELYVPSNDTKAQAEDGKMDKLMRAMRTLRSDDSPATPEQRTPADFGTPESSDRPLSQTDSPQRSRHATALAKLQIILTAFAEAVSREQNLRAESQFPADATSLFNLLMTEIGARFISAVIDGAIESSAKVDVKQQVRWSHLESVRTVGHALRLVAAFVKSVIFAMIQYSDGPAQQEIAQALNTYITNVENSCRILIEQIIETAHLRVQYLLSRQNKRDFLEPSANATSVLNGDIYADLALLAFASQSALSAENSQRLLKAVASNFCEDLHAHIQHFQISNAGGKLLSNDIVKYEQLMVHEWNLDSDISTEFATLRAIARLYTCDQSLLASLLRDSHLSRLSPGQMRAYLVQRPDFNSRTMHLLYINNDPRHLYRY